jgi:ADP-ribose pyrophosphatase
MSSSKKLQGRRAKATAVRQEEADSSPLTAKDQKERQKPNTESTVVGASRKDPEQVQPAETRTYLSASAKKPRVLSSQVIYTGKVFGIRRDEVVEPSGVRATREMITHPGSVVVLPVLPDGRVLLIRQYRYAARQFLWELVAGRIDEGETPLQAAERELREETGYRAKSFKIFLEFFPTPGFLEEKMYLLLAEGLTPGQAEPEEDEKILARAYTHREIDNMIRRGKVRDAKTVAGVLYYLRYLCR